MNKIFKVVWSKVKHCYVVVSEVAKANGKNSVKSRVGRASLAATMAVTFMLSGGTALAADFNDKDYTIDNGTNVVKTVQSGHAYGSAINTNENTTLTNCDFKGNSLTGKGSTTRGGAVYVNGDLDIIGGSFVDNSVTVTAGKAYGGAIAHQGGTLNITNTIFDNNTVSGVNGKNDYGAAIYATGSEITIEGSTFKNHTGTADGLIYLYGGSTATLGDGNVFDNNGVASVKVQSGTTLTLEGTNKFTNNSNNSIVCGGTVIFGENSETYFKDNTANYDFGGAGNVVVEKGAYVESEQGITANGDFELNGTIALGDNSNIAKLSGQNGTIEVFGDVLGEKDAITIGQDNSTNTYVTAKGLDFSEGTREVMKNFAQQLKDTVGGDTDGLVFSTVAQDNILYGDVEFKDDKVITTMDTDDLVVAGNVQANTFNGINLQESLDSKANVAEVDTALAGKVDKNTDQIVIGAGTEVSDPGNFLSNEAVVIGKGAASTGWQGDVVDNVAIGGYATVRNASTAVALGWNAKVLESGNGIAIGSESHVESAAGSTALGNRAYASGENSVALGAGSSTSEDGVISVGHQVGDKYYMGTGTVREYKDTLTRRIVNVADGVADNDAANVGQLNTAIDDVTTAYKAADTALKTEVDTALEGKVDKNTDQIVIGNRAAIKGSANGTLSDKSIVIGFGATSEGWTEYTLDNIVVGTNAHVYNASSAMALGAMAVVRGDNGIATGTEAYVDGEKSVALGNRAYAGGMDSVALGAGSSTSEDGVISVGHQVGDKYYRTGSGERTYTDTLTRKIVNVTAGELSEDSTEAVVGSQLFATNQNVTELQAKTAQISVTDSETSIDVSRKGLEVKGAGEGSFNVYSVGDQTMIYAHNGETRTFTVDAETGNVATIGGIDAGTDVVAQGKYSLVKTAQKLEGKADAVDVTELQAKTAGITRTQYQGTTTGETKVTDDFVVDTAEGKGKVTIGYIGENEMLFTTDEDGEYTFGVNAQTGEMQANGGAEIGKRADGTYNVEMNADGVAIRSGLSVAGGAFDVADNGKVTASNGLKVQTSGAGSFSFANIGTGETLFYAMSTTGSSDPTIVMNAQNGNIETQGSLSVGNGAFVSDAASGNAAVKGSLEVGGNAAVTGGIDAGTDVVAQGKYSLVETAQKVEANAEALESVQTQVSANTADIAQNKADIAQNAADIAQNTADIAANKTAIESIVSDVSDVVDTVAANTANIATNAADIAANKAAIESIDADVSGVVDSVATNKADIATNKSNIATNTANIAANAAGIQQNANAIAGLNRNVARLDSRMDKVGAGAAALAALHPLDYDAENKLSFSAGVGNYAGSTAAAVGAFYRPNEDVMFSIGGTAGNGENMVNMGVSFAIGKGSSGLAKMSKAELVQEVTSMKAENEELKQENKDIRNELNKLKELVMKLAEEK